MKKQILAILASSMIMPTFADSGFTLEGLLGRASQDTSFDDFISEKGSDKDRSIGLRAGYQFNGYTALELAYRDYGDIKENYDDFGAAMQDDVSSKSIDFGFKGMIPVADNVSLVGRIGISRWDYEAKAKDSDFPGETFKNKDSGIDIYYGIGAQYNISKEFFIAAEYNILKMDFKLDDDFEDVKGENKVKNLSLSIGYQF